MSADDEIYIQQNSKGRWVAQHWSASADGKPDPELVPHGSTYATMQLAVEMNHDRARNTEYGFNIDEGAYQTLREERLKQESFQEELRALINKHSKEQGSDTPDFILAEFLTQVLNSWDAAVMGRRIWFGQYAPRGH